jgi:STAM-binding protein
VHLSAALLDDFLRRAAANTRANIETCGILAGVLGGAAGPAAFTVTTLILPQQTGTSDTVTTLGEERVFEVQDARGLFPLGWVHTHPSQSCFLSSVDVHTQCGYQTMLDEALAVVCAPSDAGRRCGIFRVSTPGGLRLLQRCDRRGFHPHPPTDTGQPLYELTAHVYLNGRLAHDVVDLR